MPLLVQNTSTQIALISGMDTEHTEFKVVFKKQSHFTKLHSTIIWSSGEISVRISPTNSFIRTAILTWRLSDQLITVPLQYLYSQFLKCLQDLYLAPVASRLNDQLAVAPALLSAHQ